MAEVNDLLRQANDKKPADFNSTFKELIKDKIAQKLNPKPAENNDPPNDDNAGGEEENE